MSGLLGRHGGWLASQQYPSRSQDCEWHRRAIDELAPVLGYTNSRTAVELGSGEPPSYGAEMLERQGLAVTTVDAAAACDVTADMHNLPFADNAFDLVFARHSLEHCVAPLIALREARRVARWMIVVVPDDAEEWLYWGGHLSIFPRWTWEHLFRLAGWQIRYFEAGDISPDHDMRDVEWRYLLERGAEHQPPREPNGRNLGPRYLLAKPGWQ